MVLVPVSELTEESLHWCLARYMGDTPVVSTRNVEDSNGIVVGVSHYSARHFVDYQLFHLVEEKHYSFNWNSNDGWTAQSPQTRNIQRDAKMNYAAYKLLITDHYGAVVSVPECLQEE